MNQTQDVDLNQGQGYDVESQVLLLTVNIISFNGVEESCSQGCVALEKS